MINETLHLILRANVVASVAIVAIMLLRKPVRAYFGSSATYGLWGIPVILAVLALLPVPAGGVITPIVLTATESLPALPNVESGSPLAATLGGLWALGALVCATMLSADQLRYASALRGCKRLLVDGISVIRAEGADIGPAVIGRSIVVPTDFDVRFTPSEQSAVIAHEVQHLARGDVGANAIMAVILCLCWFNPLVHLASRWMRFDQELACDAAVIAAQPSLRRPYAEALLKTQTMAAIPAVGCAWRGRGFFALRTRIQLLKQVAPSRPRRAGALLLLAGLTLSGGYTAWAALPSTTPTVIAPDWSSRPSGADLARLYPAQARALRQDGSAVMACRVTLSGELSGCAIEREQPLGSGFGEATLQMAPLFKMKPKSVDGKPVAGGVVRIPVKFAVPPTGAPR